MSVQLGSTLTGQTREENSEGSLRDPRRGAHPRTRGTAVGVAHGPGWSECSGSQPAGPAAPKQVLLAGLSAAPLWAGLAQESLLTYLQHPQSRGGDPTCPSRNPSWMWTSVLGLCGGHSGSCRVSPPLWKWGNLVQTSCRFSQSGPRVPSEGLVPWGTGVSTCPVSHCPVLWGPWTRAQHAVEE